MSAFGATPSPSLWTSFMYGSQGGDRGDQRRRLHGRQVLPPSDRIALRALASALLQGNDDDDDALGAALLYLYEYPEDQPSLYDYCKSLERVESSLLGGFYYRHFCLASNVIGSTAKGTMKMSVAALKKTYERQIFPHLDITRSRLGAKLDAELFRFKGQIMDNIELQKRSRLQRRRSSV